MYWKFMHCIGECSISHLNLNPVTMLHFHVMLPLEPLFNMNLRTYIFTGSSESSWPWYSSHMRGLLYLHLLHLRTHHLLQGTVETNIWSERRIILLLDLCFDI